MSITRKRLSPEASRSAALKAARKLLLTQGPQAVTLKAVAARVGKTHANLLHHFGSAAGLQAALAESITNRVCAGIEEAVKRARAHEADPIEIVDRVFDAFGKEGAGALAAWMILSGNRDALNPVLEAIHQLVDHLRAGQRDARDIVDMTFDAFGREGAGALAAWMILTGNRDALNPVLDSIRGLVSGLTVGHEEHHVPDTTLWLVLQAVGDALLGPAFAEALGLDRDAARATAAERLRAVLDRQHPESHHQE